MRPVVRDNLWFVDSYHPVISHDRADRDGVHCIRESARFGTRRPSGCPVWSVDPFGCQPLDNSQSPHVSSSHCCFRQFGD